MLTRLQSSLEPIMPKTNFIYRLLIINLGLLSAVTGLPLVLFNIGNCKNWNHKGVFLEKRAFDSATNKRLQTNAYKISWKFWILKALVIILASQIKIFIERVGISRDHHSCYQGFLCYFCRIAQEMIFLIL